MGFVDAGHGYDLFGLHPPTLDTIVRRCAPIHDLYFRVATRGATHIPATGPAILVANHSGVLPLDAIMLGLDLRLRAAPARVARFVVDRFVPLLPFVGTLFARVGGVSGTRENVRRLLDDGELVVIFPEGTSGVRKPYRDRYRLQAWNVGHAELAIRHRVPVVPVAIVGAEESWPLAARLDRFHLFGAPYLPVPMVPLPLPTHYHIHYGAALDLPAAAGAQGADDDQLVQAAARRTRAAVEALIDEARRERTGVFR